MSHETMTAELRELDQRIRELELRLGLRDWDEQDQWEAECRMWSDPRFVNQPGNAEKWLAAERARLVAA